MKTVQLAGTDIQTTPLGFGCGQLMRIASEKSRQTLLSEAYAAGIRHFDVARMYGLGAAEKELGKFIKDKRASVVIATKFGIEINHLASRLAYMQSGARRLLTMFPTLRNLARRRGGSILQTRVYSAEKARKSLETSLRELQTDYVDLFLLHEPTLNGIINSDVLEFLEAAKRQGTIRAFGVAGPSQDVFPIVRDLPEISPIVQIPNDAVSRHKETLPLSDEHAVITYSPFSNALGRVVDHVAADSRTARRWEEVVGIDCSSPGNVAAFLLRYALNAVPSGVVLFSTGKPERLKQLVGVADEGADMERSLSAFLACVEEEIR